MVRVVGTIVVIALLFALFFVGTEVYSWQRSLVGNLFLGGATGLGLGALFKLWRG